MTTSTTDGSPSRCTVCGKRMWITPAEPFADATCPHCGALVWFDTTLAADIIKALADRGVEVDLDAEGEVTRVYLTGMIYDDSTVPQLARMQGLELLDVRETRITATGVNKLRELMPDVSIVFE